MSDEFQMEQANKINLAIQKRAFRLWFEYLKVARQSTKKDVKSALTVSQPYYAPWEMDKAAGFDAWWINHAHLFEEKYTVRVLKNGERSADPEALIVEIPLTQSPTILTRKVKSIIQNAFEAHEKKSRKGKSKPTAYYKLTEGSEPKFDAIREMLSVYRDVYLHDPKIRGDRLLEETHRYYLKKKNKKYAKVPMAFQHDGSVSDKIRAMRNLRRYVQKAEKVVLNVARGQFPGVY
jgi:hypothetical protein